MLIYFRVSLTELKFFTTKAKVWSMRCQCYNCTKCCMMLHTDLVYFETRLDSSLTWLSYLVFLICIIWVFQYHQVWCEILTILSIFVLVLVSMGTKHTSLYLYNAYHLHKLLQIHTHHIIETWLYRWLLYKLFFMIYCFVINIICCMLSKYCFHTSNVSLCFLYICWNHHSQRQSNVHMSPWFPLIHFRQICHWLTIC